MYMYMYNIHAEIHVFTVPQMATEVVDDTKKIRGSSDISFNIYNINSANLTNCKIKFYENLKYNALINVLS